MEAFKEMLGNQNVCALHDPRSDFPLRPYSSTKAVVTMQYNTILLIENNDYFIVTLYLIHK